MPYEINIADPDSRLRGDLRSRAGDDRQLAAPRGRGAAVPAGRGSRRTRASGSTFALPLLHPWANRVRAWDFELGEQQVTLDPESPITHRDAATGTAIHGLLTASPHWTVTDADRNTLTAELDFGAVPEYMAAFPFPHIVRYTAHDRGLDADGRLRRARHRRRRVPISFGFHPYLTLPGSDRRSWQVRDPGRAPGADRRAHAADRGDASTIAPGRARRRRSATAPSTRAMPAV